MLRRLLVELVVALLGVLVARPLTIRSRVSPQMTSHGIFTISSTSMLPGAR